ncbi:hypothetical protein M0813_16910 [Anaeramoeba flamelloides]|uniref:Uncharacterized protein n=1 Tax=Anaeramoeba flamelloides TaxID=1746091 RepID=A0ABQ8YYC2_9EUKA|nr:hypothetical protein M0813_16910 [Anaeramoeba flamelloides]
MNRKNLFIFLFSICFLTAGCARLNKMTLVEYLFQEGEATTCSNNIDSYLDLDLSAGGCSWLMDTEQRQGLSCDGSQITQINSGPLANHLCDWTSQCDSEFDYSGGCQHFALEFWWDKPEDDGDEEYQVWYVTNTDYTTRPLFGITYDSTLEGVGGLVVRISGRTPVGIVNKIYNWGTADLKTAGLKHIMISSEIAGGEAYYHCYLNGTEKVSAVKDFTSFMMVNGQPDYSDTDYRNSMFPQYGLKGKIYYSAIHDSFYDQAEAQQNYEAGLPESRPFLKCSTEIEIDGSNTVEGKDIQLSDACTVTCDKGECDYDFKIAIGEIPDARSLQLYEVPSDTNTASEPIKAGYSWDGKFSDVTFRSYPRDNIIVEDELKIQVDPIGQTLGTYPSNIGTVNLKVTDNQNHKPTFTANSYSIVDTDGTTKIVLTASDPDTLLGTVEAITCPAKGKLYQYGEQTDEFTCNNEKVDTQYGNEFWVDYTPDTLSGVGSEEDQIQFVAKNDQESEIYTVNILISNSLTSGNDKEKIEIEASETVSFPAANSEGSFFIRIDQVPASSEGRVYRKGDTSDPLKADDLLDKDAVEVDFVADSEVGNFDLLFTVLNNAQDKESEQGKFTFKTYTTDPQLSITVPGDDVEVNGEDTIEGVSISGSYTDEDEIKVGIFSKNGHLSLDYELSSNFEWEIGVFESVYAMKFICPAPQSDDVDHCNKALASLAFTSKTESTESVIVTSRIIGTKDIHTNSFKVKSTLPTPTPEPTVKSDSVNIVFSSLLILFSLILLF